MTEQDIQRDILAYLSLRGIEAWKTQVGTPGGKYRVGRAGVPDIVGYLPGGRFLGIEVKNGHRGAVSAAQDEWIERAMTAGCCTFVARSLDEAKEIIEIELRQ